MNSYFASVEQQANPFLRGKLVGVCAYLTENGVILASSKEAKEKGIKTGCKVKEALKLDPRVILVENDPAKYRTTTEKIFHILSQYTDKMEPYSIDEAFLDLTGWVKDYQEAQSLAVKIQLRIQEEVGEWLRCSIGISWTKFLAKFAGDIAPKSKILIIDAEQLEEHLNRPLREAWGIGKMMEERLNKLGIYTLLELKNYDALKLKSALGSYGYYLWANVNGKEISEIDASGDPPKSIGHSCSLPKKTTDKDYLEKIIYKLCEKTGRRLRALKLEAKIVTFHLAYIYEGNIHKSFKPGDKIFTTEEIFSPLQDFLKKTAILLPIKLIAVSVSSLSPLSGQLSFLYDNAKKENLSRAMDKLNDKFGEYSVVRGAMFNTKGLARDRIGFRKTVSFID